MTRRRLSHAVASGADASVEKDLQFTADIFPLGIGRYMQHVRSTDQFFADAANGTLPAFTSWTRTSTPIPRRTRRTSRKARASRPR